MAQARECWVTLATAAFGRPTRRLASELPQPPRSRRQTGNPPSRNASFSGFRRAQHTLAVRCTRPRWPQPIDMDAVVSKKAAKKYTERSYIFSDALTAKSDLLDELEQLDEDANDRQLQKTASTVVMWGGAAGVVYLSVQGLQGVERWMKRQEEEDIEAERELTGQYVSVDAGDVESVIDPKTGKNITIAKRDIRRRRT